MRRTSTRFVIFGRSGLNILDHIKWTGGPPPNIISYEPGAPGEVPGGGSLQTLLTSTRYGASDLLPTPEDVMHHRLHPLSLACIALVFAGCAGNSTNVAPVATGPTFRFTEAAGTFYKDYTGPQRPAVSAIGADGAFSAAAQTITLIAKMAGPVFTGGPNYYVWGFDRGTASAKAAPFPDEPTVKFDAVMVVTADPANGTTLTGVINLLNGSTPQTVSPVLVAADTIQVTFPASMLPSTGAAPAQYTWNLWPRTGLGGTP
ncbi:MAG TPA: hypothetical protein VGT98_01015, partial [Candidatus Elarobacter sp.]|nr:hypothetical protein [Candidatus Elarobacter sp.]